ncbi:uncharacterized protein LOC127277490 [Leptopilina boulardi]|uniref:uncharacterized protein LOC127277489 n=1 Tax=Leptopilina boulardi TaxID=63433 RepID=UPI0021F56859|nr:uncharacterized protein LOC127277489 [Leptopilina boulardi]XP_051154609.1 uncharacterized protein LOC127277490 [Leptopilina boulardi]
MEVGNLANPLGTLQTISVLSCMSALSDVLFEENFLKGTDENNKIPIINALYHYSFDKNNKLDSNQRKIRLAEKVGSSCNLKGVKDPNVINKNLNHVIESVIFEKYGSIDGFIAYSQMAATDYSLKLPELLKETLKNVRFYNDNGGTSYLDQLAVDQIFNDLIKPLLPGKKIQ